MHCASGKRTGNFEAGLNTDVWIEASAGLKATTRVSFMSVREL